jgi:hypothetical protein
MQDLPSEPHRQEHLRERHERASSDGSRRVYSSDPCRWGTPCTWTLTTSSTPTPSFWAPILNSASSILVDLRPEAYEGASDSPAGPPRRPRS